MDHAPPPLPKWWLSQNGSVIGPFTEAQVVASISNETVSPRCLCCLDGQTQWQLLSTWPQFHLVEPIQQAAQSECRLISPPEVIQPEYDPDDPRYHYRRWKRDKDLKATFWWSPLIGNVVRLFMRFVP